MTRLLWFLMIPREDNVREKLAAERKEKEAYAKKVGQLTMQVVLIVFTGDKMDKSAKLFSILFQMMDNGSITAENDIFTIQAMYHLYENKKVVDRKKEIESLYDEFDRKRGIIRTLPRPFLDDIL